MFRCVLPDRPEAELRLFQPCDAEAYFDLIETNRTWLHHSIAHLDAVRSLADAETAIAAMHMQWIAQTAVYAGLWERGTLAGSISLRAIHRRHRRATMDYWLGERFTGRGLMTQACLAMLDYAFTTRGLNRVEIHCPADNLPARAIPRRLGFTEEGIAHDARWLCDRFVADVRYGMLAREWQGRESGRP